MANRGDILLNLPADTLLAANQRLLDGVPPYYSAATEDPDTGCLQCQAAPNKTGLTRKLRMSLGGSMGTIEVPKGYPRVKIGQQMVYAHHISFMAANVEERNKSMFQSSWRDTTMEISHICGNPKCVNPNHLLLEPEQFNKHRDACHALAFNFSCPSCSSVIDTCPHVPRCIKKMKQSSMAKPAVLVANTSAVEVEVPSASQSLMEQSITEEQKEALEQLSQVYQPAQMELLKVSNTAEELQHLADAAAEASKIEVLEDVTLPEAGDHDPDLSALPPPSAAITPQLPLKRDAWRMQLGGGKYVSGLKRRKC